MSKLNDLARQLLAAKQKEAEARHERELIEVKIYREVQATQEIPEKGTVSAGPVKITTTMGESWDQEALEELSRVLPPEHFPFQRVWKVDGRAKNRLAVDHPQAYRKLFPALSVKPRKPSFVIDEEKL